MSAGSLARALRKLTILHGGKDFETPDPQFLGAGEPGGIRPLGNGLYGYAVRSPEDVDNALHQARKYAKNYGGSTPTLHAFELEVGPGEVSSNAKWARELDTPEMKQVSSLYRLANSLPVGEERSRAFAQAHEAAKILPENDHKLAPISTEELPIGLEEVAVKDLSRLLRKGKWSADTDPALIRKELFPDSEGSADPDLLSAMNAGTYLGSLARALRKGLPMDEASRLQRAEELGYTTSALHGSLRGDIQEFRPGHKEGLFGDSTYFTDYAPDSNENYAGGTWADMKKEVETANGLTSPEDYTGGANYPVLLRNRNPVSLLEDDEHIIGEDLGRVQEEIAKLLEKKDFSQYTHALKKEDIPKVLSDENASYRDVDFWLREEGFDGSDIGELFKNLGFSGIKYPGELTELPNSDLATHHVIFDPADIRSKFAAFDPANEGKSDILGAADPDLLSAMNAGTYLGSNLPEGTPTGQEPGAKDYLTMLLRGTVQGTAADALSGLYGLAHGGDVQKIQEAQDVLGYKPEGAEAQAASNLGELLAPIMEPISNAVDWVGDRSPIAGAVLQSAPVVAGLPAALRAGRTVNRAANRVLAEELRRPSGAKSAQRGHFRYFDYTNEPSESRTRARKALEHLDNGVPAAEVWKQYGWGREPVTNRPITEVSDSRLEVPSNKLYRGPDGGTLLFGARKGDTGEHLLKDSILQGESYLKYLDPNYKIRGNRQKNLGSATHYAPFATESGLIEMGPQASYADFMDVLVHELNHGMQSRFGAPRGGSPEQFGYRDFEKKYFDADEEYRNHIESLMDKLPAPLRAGISSGNVTPEILGRRDSQIIQNAGRLPPDPEIQRILIESLRAMEQKKLFKSEMRGARKKYENLHGEAMSRLAQNRRNLSPQQNGAIYPFEPTYFKQQTGTDIGDLDVRL